MRRSNPHADWRQRMHMLWSANLNRVGMFVITRNPSDHPGKYVVRLHWSLPAPLATGHHVVANSLTAVRRAIPPHLHHRPRAAADDPVIVETWL